MKTILENSLLSDIVSNTQYLPRVKIIGLGGAGGNIIDKITARNIFPENLDIIAINIDRQSLDNCSAPIKLPIGDPKAYGAGGKIDTGREAATNSKDEIAKILHNTDLLFIIAGMGGGTGTGASSVIANIAKELNILTVATVTTPLLSEGTEKMQRAELGIKQLLEDSDSVIIIDNEKSMRTNSKNIATTGTLFDVADDSIIGLIENIYKIISGYEKMNIDFADIRSALQNSGIGFIGEAKAKGTNAITRALQSASNSNVLKKESLKGAKSIILSLTLPENITNNNIKPALEYLNKFTQGAETKFGLHHSKQNFVQVVVIGTNFTENDNFETELSPSNYTDELESWVPKAINENIPAIIIKKHFLEKTKPKAI